MKKAAAAVPAVLALTAVAFVRAAHHEQPVVSGSSTVDSGYYPPRNWNEIEISVPSGGF